MMSPFELIDLSMTSSRAKRAVTIFSRIKPRFSVRLYLRREQIIFIKGHEEEWGYVWRTNQSPTRRLLYFISAPSKNPRADCLKWYEMIKEILGCNVNDMCVPSPDKPLTDWLRSHQSSIEKITMISGEKEDVKYFFKTMNVFGKIDLAMSRSENDFRLEFPEGLNHLELFNTEFVTYKQLLRLKARNIVFTHSILTDQEINGFLKSWMSMESHLDLECFEMTFHDEEALREIMDLPNQMIADSNLMEKMRRIFIIYTMTTGFNIKRCDGKVATVCLGRFLFTTAVLFNSSLIGTD
uniref:FBA_2 domain-containing protein n=1 Tax=Caenorhabditis tropicalis TaxID=1561998 RepID=A0A1I7TUJ9_9PELO